MPGHSEKHPGAPGPKWRRFRFATPHLLEGDALTRKARETLQQRRCVGDGSASGDAPPAPSPEFHGQFDFRVQRVEAPFIYSTNILSSQDKHVPRAAALSPAAVFGVLARRGE